MPRSVTRTRQPYGWFKKWAKPLITFAGRQRMRFISRENLFTRIYNRNIWGSEESVSGPGSTLEATRVVRECLPRLLAAHGVKTFLDVPCGDFHWMREVRMGTCRYVGADIVDSLIQANQKQYGTVGREFTKLDLTSDRLPQADLALCRDCLVHLSFEDGVRALKNLKANGVTYLLATTYPRVAQNKNIITGSWRRINLELAPYNLGKPLELISEEDSEDPKYLGLWRLADAAL